MEYFCQHWLDIVTTALGLAYILLQYRASIWLWVVGFCMESLGIVLYFQKGLYADCGMEIYYLAMTIYGFWKWKKPLSPSGRLRGSELRSERGDGVKTLGVSSPSKLEGVRGRVSSTPTTTEQEAAITHFPIRLAIGWTLATLVIWGALYAFLAYCTDSRVPMADSFTTALSFVGIWALARKYLEQWLIWIAVDVVSSVLYFYKDIPFKASLYALYVVIAVLGYFKWKKMMKGN